MSVSLDIKTFLAQTKPFDGLSGYDIELLSQKVDIAYFKKDAVIVSENDNMESFYIIAKGIVYDGVNYLDEKDCFDFSSLLAGKSACTYKAEEESLIYTIAKKDFFDFLHANPKIEHSFLQSAAKKLSLAKEDMQNGMLRKVCEIAFGKPLFVSCKSSIFTTVQKMSEVNSTFALIDFEGEIGIVTDSDLRKKVILQKRSYDEPIGEIATMGIFKIDANDFLFNAMLEMTKHNVKRLVVVRDGVIIGVLQDIDILSSFSNQTQFLVRKIDKAQTTLELKDVLLELNSVIERLLQEGVKARHICKLTSELNLWVFKKLYDMLASDEIKQNICLVISGSEGRGEQILRTDQDNMIIIKDGFTSDKIEQFATAFHDALIEIGFPECPGGIMVTNPLWRGSLDDFKNKIFDAINHPSADGFVLLPILMDIKAVGGDTSLCDELKEYLASHLSSRILSSLANASLAFETPLSLFNAFILNKKEHSGELDIKKGGIFAIVNGVRVLAYEKQITTPNSFEKLKELSRGGYIDDEFAKEIVEAYNFLLEIRLRERLYKIKTGHTPDNYINPARLSKLERDLLKEVFQIVDKLKKYIHTHFKLGYIS